MLDYKFDDYLTIEECKYQLRIHHDRENDDIKNRAEIALVAVANYLNRDVYPINKQGAAGARDMYFNRAVKGAVLLLLSDLYENRVINMEQAANRNSVYDMLLAPWVNYAVEGL